jgi:predicted double-glycine peptidase
MGYRHFAVLRGIEQGRVYLADPARGNIRKRIDQFVTEWEKGIVFVLGKPGEEHMREYPLKPPRPFDDVPPELFGVIDMQQQGIDTSNLSLRGY